MSLEKKCYISIATLKRAELGKAVSRQTLNKLVKFFDIEPEDLFIAHIKPGGKITYCFEPMLQPVIINWDLLATLPDTTEHEHISYICSELHSLLLKLNSDEIICEIFSLKMK